MSAGMPPKNQSSLIKGEICFGLHRVHILMHNKELSKLCLNVAYNSKVL